MVGVEVGLEHTHVLGIGDGPVEGREVLALRQLLVEAPKHLHDGEGGGGDGVGEVAAWGRHSAYDGHGAFTVRRAQGLDTTSTLVESYVYL